MAARHIARLLSITAVLLLGACDGGGASGTGRAAKAPAAVAPTPAMVAEVGRKIFFDTSMSASGKMACATCHSPEHAYGPPNALAVQLGGPGMDKQGFRAVPSLRYVLNRTPRWAKQYQADPVERAIETDSVPMGGFARDGRFDTLHEQARAPLMDPAEMANSSDADVARKLRASSYAAEFVQAFGAETLADDKRAVDAMLQALERFQLDDPSFHPYTSKFDRHLAGREQLTAQEARGLRVFIDPTKGNCAACHTAAPGANGAPPLFTDFSFSALGVPRNPRLPANEDAAFFDLGICGPLRQHPGGDAQSHCGMFKTPSLRNVAARGVFMHNGVFTDLESAVRFYAERDIRPKNWYPTKAGKLVQYDDLPPQLRNNVDVIDAPLNRAATDAPPMTASEIKDVVAFLSTLTDDDVAALPLKRPR